MAADNTSNPYGSQGPELNSPSLAWVDLQGLNYGQSFKFVFENPNWIANVLFAFLCNLVGGFVPILPGLVLIGYQCEMLESLLVRPQEPYPDFKVERIMDYLMRGIWPFLIALLASVVIVPIMLVVVAVPVVAMIVLLNAAGNQGEEVVLFVMVPLIVIVVIITAILCNIVFVPFGLRAALTQDVGASLDFAFAKDFVRRMWKETIYAGLFLICLAVIAQIVGLLLFCVGVLFTVPIVQFAQVHLGMQLYRIYMARGGEKIPLKSPVPAVGA